MHWRDSWTYGIRELVSEAPTRCEERVLGWVQMERGHISGFVCGSCGGVSCGSAEFYDSYGASCPERYREVERQVEGEVRSDTKQSSMQTVLD